MPENGSGTRRVAVTDILRMFDAGTVTVTANGLPLLSLDAATRSLGIEENGVKESGLELSTIVKAGGRGGGVTGLLRGAESFAKGLADNGWRVTLYDRGDTVLSAGHGVSRLTGYVSASPLKLRKILDAL